MLPGSLNALQLIGAAVVCSVTLLRVDLLRQSRNSRLLWLAMASLSVGQSLQVESVYQHVEAITNVPGSAAIIKHVAALFAAANTAAVVDLLLRADMPHRAGRRTWFGLGAAAVIATAPWIIDPPAAVPTVLIHRAEYYDTTWRSVVHWAAFLSYLCWALAVASRLCWHYRQVETHQTTRTAVSLVGAGTTIGLGYVVEKAVTVIAWAAGRGTPAVITFDQAVEAVVLACSVSLIAIGTGWEAGHVWLSRRRYQHECRRARRDVQPLLTLLRREFPSLKPPATLATASERVVSAVALIYDGLRWLTTYAPPPTTPGEAADGDDLARYQQAAWLRDALARKAAGQAPRYPITTPPINDTGQSVEAARYLSALYRQAGTIDTAFSGPATRWKERIQ